MKKNIPVIITLLSVAVAAGGISFGVRATHQKAKLQEEAQALRDRLDDQSVLPDREPVSEGVTGVALTEFSGRETNDVNALQEQLTARDAELERLRAELADIQTRPRRESFQDRMNRMKEEDPDRYEEMVKSRTERKEQMRYNQANRLALYMDMDTSSMTPEELVNHNLLVDKLTEVWEKTAEYDPTQPPTRETMHEMFSTLREVNDLMEQERGVMLRQLGKEVGLSGSEAEDFAAYTESIISATTLRSPRGGRGPSGNN